MPWFKVDDGFTASRKVISIPRKDRMLAIGLWTMAGNFAARELTDGFVPDYVLDDLGAPEETIEALIKAGLWDRVPEGIQFHDWCEYQPSAEEYRAKQKALHEKRSINGKKGAAIRWANKDDGKSIANEWQKDNPEPEPEPEPNLRELPASPISEDFSPDFDHSEWAKTEWPAVNWEAETAKFVNYFLSHGTAKVDWQAAWRNWIIIAGERLNKKADFQDFRYPDGRF